MPFLQSAEAVLFAVAICTGVYLVGRTVTMWLELAVDKIFSYFLGPPPSGKK